MKAGPQILADNAARYAAMAIHGRSFLVEAGAGSGKTAVMAGRVALLFAAGVAPKRVAAVTFTELAASELLVRIRESTSQLSKNQIPAELRIALPDGVSETQRRYLLAAASVIDEMTCSTIHGFCQRLIKPYPVEADIDPGAGVMDSTQADLVFQEMIDAWLRGELAKDGGGLIAELVLRDAPGTVDLLHTILRQYRGHPEMRVEAPEALAPLVEAYQEAAKAFASFLSEAGAEEPGTAEISAGFSQMALALRRNLPGDQAAQLASLLFERPHPDLCTNEGEFRAYQKKGKWNYAAKVVGLSNADGDRLNLAASTHYAGCCAAWRTLSQAAAARVLSDLVGLAKPVADLFRTHKRSAALLDFDDLIFAACALLRDHDAVRRALGDRFTHVLVDEFQDTDPRQAEIFWRLCGDPPTAAASADWATFLLRPGALFLVGDPKQAIYRFRGADVAAYVRAREMLLAQHPDGVLSISTNFRSCEPILSYVNKRFELVLSVEMGQPGFTALKPFHPGRDNGLCVAALDVAVADESGKASVDQQRDCEAEAVADICARLIGTEAITDRTTGSHRLCRPGDIALLAPTGTDLWRYEEALEMRGVPVATQAGKGLFRRQEIQDLIALTRVLADQRDTLALGALLRGPLVGLTEEALLDIVWALPRSDDAPNMLSRLDLGTPPDAIIHPQARDVITRLQALRRQINTTTPHELLSQAVDVMRVRPILLQRHRDQGERALSNVDLYLSLSRAYAVRGLRAFAEGMSAAWTDEARAVEGRPDAQEEAVALYTMHAAKGLEWPIVIPINTMTKIRAPQSAVLDRENSQFYCKVFGLEPTGYVDARNAEVQELERQRVRLWYVASTRARELLVLPRLDVAADDKAWLSVVDLALSELTSLDLGDAPTEPAPEDAKVANAQTREVFADEARAVAESQRKIVWLAPSRGESSTELPMEVERPAVLVTDLEGAPIETTMSSSIQGGRERGIILHKLLEEVLTGETSETQLDLSLRADTLIRTLGQTAADDPATGLVAAELAACVGRTLALPDIEALRPALLPEFPVYRTMTIDAQETVTAGIIDAIALSSDGVPCAVIDWKSDVHPTSKTLDRYRSQVQNYLAMTDVQRGLIVLLNSGAVINVTRGTAEIPMP